MIPVTKVKEPTGFDAKVRTTGKLWLNANPKTKRPKALWEPFIPDLANGFANRCGYAAMLDPTGAARTV